MKRILFFFLFFNFSFLLSLYADEEVFEKPTSNLLQVKHKEAKGIGHTKGYSSVQWFWTPHQFLSSSYLPFVDLRAHVFNNGKFAANGSLGCRYLIESKDIGLGLFTSFDYRKNKTNYYQLDLGLEMLSPFLDTRLIGYLPVGRQRSRPSEAHFLGFKGHNLVLFQKLERSLGSLFLEVGTNLYKDYLYAGIGPYYLHGKKDRGFGGKTHINAKLGEYFSCEFSFSYDHLFRRRTQGFLSFTYPFGKAKSAKTKNSIFAKSLRLPPYREEIIPVIKSTQESVAINPETNAPFVFWFVDNQSNSLGTYESPYPTLAQAQNSSSPHDIIYVFPGDGTTTGMSNGIVLKDYQRLLSAHYSYVFNSTLTEIIVPANAASNPTITNSSGNVVVLADQNEIFGFNILATNGRGIYHDEGDYFLPNDSITIQESTITAGAYDAIHLISKGTITIQNNTLTGDDESGTYGIYLKTGTAETVTTSITNNTISHFESGIDVDGLNSIMSPIITSNTISYGNKGISLSADTDGRMTSTVSNNTLSYISKINDTGTWGIGIGAEDGGRAYSTIDSNTLLHLGNTTQGIAFTAVGETTHTVAITNNTLQHDAGSDPAAPLSISSISAMGTAGGLLTSAAITNNSVTAAANALVNLTFSGISVDQGSLSTVISQNSISGTNGNSISVDTTSVSTHAEITISNNTLSDILRNSGQGISVISAENNTSPNILTVTNNTLNTSDGSLGLFIETQKNAWGSNTLLAKVTNNTFTGSSGVAITNATGGALDSSSLCLQLTGNTCNDGFTLINTPTAIGTFQLEWPLSPANTGTVTETGTITHVAPNYCGFSD